MTLWRRNPLPVSLPRRARRRGAPLWWYVVSVMLAIALGYVCVPELLGVRPRWPHDLLWGLVGGVFLVLSTRALERWSRAVRDLSGALAYCIADIPGPHFGVIAVLSAVGEEVLFRGVVQAQMGPWLAAGLFAVMHLGRGRGFTAWPLLAFGAGLVFSALLALTGSLWAPILAHASVNYANLRHLRRRQAEKTSL